MSYDLRPVTFRLSRSDSSTDHSAPDTRAPALSKTSRHRHFFPPHFRHEIFPSPPHHRAHLDRSDRRRQRTVLSHKNFGNHPNRADTTRVLTSPQPIIRRKGGTFSNKRCLFCGHISRP